MNPDVLTASPVAEAMDAARRHLRSCGTWWDADEVGAIADRAAGMFARRADPPWMRPSSNGAGPLPHEIEATIDVIATNAGSIDRAWASRRVEDLGDGAYVELVGIIAIAVILAMYAEGAGLEPAMSSSPIGPPARPSQERPDGVRDIGAYVHMTDPFPMANVGRALSLVPSVNLTFLSLVHAMYSAPGFTDLVWDTPLTRPQVELIASRVAAMNECFY